MKRVPQIEPKPISDQTIQYDHFKSVDFFLILIFGTLVVIATINHPLRDPRPINPTCELR